CCSLSGFGGNGPRASEPGFDYLIQGYAGYMGVTGEPDGPPGKCGVSVIDFAGGYAGMLGLMVGLFEAQRTGVGREVEVSLLDTAVSMLSYFAIWTLNRDWQPERIADSGHQTLVPAQTFPTRDGWIVIFCNKDKFWQALVQRMELPELPEDPRFTGFAERFAHKAALVEILKARFAKKTTAEWLGLLRGHVPCAPVHSLAGGPPGRPGRAPRGVIEVRAPHFGPTPG